MEEFASLKFTKEIETNISEIDIQIGSYKSAIVNLEKERQNLKQVLHLEKAAFFTTNWLPDEVQDLNIYYLFVHTTVDYINVLSDIFFIKQYIYFL